MPSSSPPGRTTTAKPTASTSTKNCRSGSGVQHGPKSNPETYYSNSSRAHHTRSESSEAPVKRGTEKNGIENRPAAVRKTQNKTPQKPVARSRKVKEYCHTCETRRRIGGYKIRHCGNCEYYGSEPETGAAGGVPSQQQGATPSNASPTKSEKLYCDECTERKNAPGDDGRSRKNAKHRCADCLRLRDEASSSREGSKPQSRLQSGSQSVKATTETSTNDPGPEQPCKRKRLGGDEIQRRVQKHDEPEPASGTVNWLHTAVPRSQSRGEDEESSAETEEEDPYTYRPGNRGSVNTSTIRAEESPKKLARQDLQPVSWAQSLAPEHSGADFEPCSSPHASADDESPLYLNSEPLHTNDGEGGPEDQQQVPDRLESALPMPEIVPDYTELPSSSLGAGFQPWAREVILHSGYIPPSLAEDVLSSTSDINDTPGEDGSWLSFFLRNEPK